MAADEVTTREFDAQFNAISAQLKSLHDDNTNEHARLREHVSKIHERIDRVEGRVIKLENWRAFIVGGLTIIGILGGFIIHAITGL